MQALSERQLDATCHCCGHKRHQHVTKQDLESGKPQLLTVVGMCRVWNCTCSAFVRYAGCQL